MKISYTKAKILTVSAFFLASSAHAFEATDVAAQLMAAGYTNVDAVLHEGHVYVVATDPSGARVKIIYDATSGLAVEEDDADEDSTAASAAASGLDASGSGSGSGDDASGSGDDASGSGDDASGSGDDASGSGDDASGSGDEASGSGGSGDDSAALSISPGDYLTGGNGSDLAFG